MTEDLRAELIIAIENEVGPWVALNDWPMFGSQALAYVESMNDNQLINTAIELNIMTEEEAAWLR